jgi:hypothetical protein
MGPAFAGRQASRERYAMYIEQYQSKHTKPGMVSPMTHNKVNHSCREKAIRAFKDNNYCQQINNRSGQNVY